MLKISRDAEINLINIFIDQDFISGKDLIEIKKLSSENEKSQIESIFNIMFDTISDNMTVEKSVELRNFGRFSVKTTKAKYNARNPKTGEVIYVPEKKKVSFKMSKHLKQEINENIKNEKKYILSS
jgi:nucleoid DNA-binding protein